MIDLKSAAIKGVPTKGAAIFTKWLVCVVVISFSASLMAQDKSETKSWDELPDWSGWWDARGVRNTGGLGRVLGDLQVYQPCLLYTSPSPRDATLSRMPSSA